MDNPLHDPMSDEFYASAQAGNYDERDRYWWAPYALQALTWALAFGVLWFFLIFLRGPL